ncbi:MAG: maleylpyruvate isomerase family mycothiol-dependent enzyme [Thermomicrobiales bacterium]|nr:maleylpyruvate isomerase family mycothiol-dependent enzyme [Thermomicrobiales bacterium]
MGLFDDQPVIDTRSLFRPEREALLEVLAQLTPAQWSAPTVCDGWSVHDVALHLLWVDISNISRRRDGYFGRPQDDPGDLSDLGTLIDFVNELNNNWVSAARRMSPALLQTLLRATGDEFSTWAERVDIHALGGSVDWAGPGPAPVWLDIAREFTERWVHQQHIRDATGLPGTPDPQFVSPVIGTFAMALPYALRDVDVPVGTAARLTVTGEEGGIWTAVREEDRWVFGDHSARVDAAGSVELDARTAWRLFTRGLAASDAGRLAGVSGDPEIVQAMLNMVTILA